MIRAFTIFCKLNFIKLTDWEMFTQTIEDFSRKNLSSLKLPCPKCGAKCPQWTAFAFYERYLISFEKGSTVIRQIEVPRILCSSCEGTHAILPEVIIPYRCYSLMFILTVLRDYFYSHMTVDELCNKYLIAPSTLYVWKRLFLTHKKLWLGILEDAIRDSLTFLSTIPTSATSDDLARFFHQHARSFLQGICKTACFNST